MNIFLDVLKVIDVVDFLRLFDSSQEFLGLCELSLIYKDFGEFDFGVEIFGVGF
jgi:hypothetical protein